MVLELVCDSVLVVFDQVKKENKVKIKNKKGRSKKKERRSRKIAIKKEGKKKRVKPQVVSPPMVLF